VKEAICLAMKDRIRANGGTPISAARWTTIAPHSLTGRLARSAAYAASSVRMRSCRSSTSAAPSGKVIIYAPWYIFYRISLRKHTGSWINDFTAGR
jgi:hypothetical protein